MPPAWQGAVATIGFLALVEWSLRHRVAGVPIAEGERVTLWYPSGNRDAEFFDLLLERVGRLP